MAGLACHEIVKALEDVDFDFILFFQRVEDYLISGKVVILAKKSILEHQDVVG